MLVGEQCGKLERLRFLRISSHSHYASATIVVREDDEEGNYRDYTIFGDALSR